MKKTEKACSLCEQVKEKALFSMAEKGNGKNEYCDACKEAYKHHHFILSKASFVLDAVTEEETNVLILCDLVEYRKNKYTLKDERHYVENVKGNIHQLNPPAGMILALGKYQEKKNRFPKKKAQQIVDEGAAVWEGEGCIRYLFSGKELEEYVIERDKGMCQNCKKAGDRIAFRISRSQHGLLSPMNSYCCCANCKKEVGEDLYFNRWLNVSILKEEEREREDWVSMHDVKKQTTFAIKRKDAEQLVNQEMAEWEGNGDIRILYGKKTFKSFIFTRDNNTCAYCNQYGDTLDHVLPQANGGMTTPKNCVCACSECNNKKRDKDRAEFESKRKR